MLCLSIDQVHKASANDDNQGKNLGIGEVVLEKKGTNIYCYCGVKYIVQSGRVGRVVSIAAQCSKTVRNTDGYLLALLAPFGDKI